jgi:AAA domain
MPTLDSPDIEEPMKVLLIGNSGSGKTGALASLARAGYNLKILDFDRGTSILRNILRGDTESLRRVEVETLTDTYKAVGAKVIPGKVEAWAKGMGILTKWTAESTMNDVIVIDSLNFASKAAFNWILQLANRLAAPKEIQDWGAAQDLVEAFLFKLYSSETKCHVICTSHITYFGSGDSDIQVGYPATAVGRSFSPKVPRFFNSCLLVRNTGTGAASKREIYTKPIDHVDLKTESLEVSDRYQLKNGLAEYFFDVRGKKPLDKPQAAE